MGLAVLSTRELERREYKALSVVAPSGDRIRAGQKTLEIRTWRPQALPLRDLVIVQNTRPLISEGAEDPDGTVVAVVDVESVQPWREDQLEAACAERWSPGFFAWSLRNIRLASSPGPIKAARGIYTFSASVIIER